MKIAVVSGVVGVVKGAYVTSKKHRNNAYYQSLRLFHGRAAGGVCQRGGVSAELALAAGMIPLALWVDVSPAERALLLVSVFLVLIVELLNSAIEAIVDRVGTEHHELSGKAKDIGSAAVFIALLLVAVVWAVILLPQFV